jgi:hypothetical protein
MTIEVRIYSTIDKSPQGTGEQVIRLTLRFMLNKVTREKQRIRRQSAVFQVARATGAVPTIIPCLAKLRVPCSRHAARSFVWLFLPSSVLSLGACRYVQGRVDRCFVNRTLVVTCLLLFFFLCLQPVLVRISLYASRLGVALAKDLRSYPAPFSFPSHIYSHAWTLQNSTINPWRSHSFQRITTFTCLSPAILLYRQHDNLGEPVFSLARF